MPKTLMQAIAAMEGFYKPGSRPNRNHNPGDLEFHSWQVPYGAQLEPQPATGAARFAVFPSDERGFACMAALLAHPAAFVKDPHAAGSLFRDALGNRRIVPGSGYLGATIAEGLNEWAPPVENNVSAYLHGVELMTALPGSTVITADLLR